MLHFRKGPLKAMSPAKTNYCADRLLLKLVVSSRYQKTVAISINFTGEKAVNTISKLLETTGRLYKRRG